MGEGSYELGGAKSVSGGAWLRRGLGARRRLAVFALHGGPELAAAHEAALAPVALRHLVLGLAPLIVVDLAEVIAAVEDVLVVLVEHANLLVVVLCVFKQILARSLGVLFVSPPPSAAGARGVVAPPPPLRRQPRGRGRARCSVALLIVGLEGTK